MSLINEYRATEEALKELKERLDALGSDERLLKEMEFEDKLRGLMSEYNKSLKNIIDLLDPQPLKRAAAVGNAPKRRERKVKVYLNPNNGQVIETKGGNHKILKEWKAEHGNDVVESWVKE